MAINLVSKPGASTPISGTDYDSQNNQIEGNQLLGGQILTDWVSTAAAPAISQGVFIRQAGNLYEVQSSDASISGTPSAGINYIALTVSGTTLTAAWVTSLSGYTHNQAYNGWYNGTTQLLFNGVYLDGSDYVRGIALNNMPYQWSLADGRLFVDAKNVITNGGNIDSGGGDISADGGDVSTGGGDISADGGDVSTGGGDISTGGGDISADGGDVSVGGGDISTGGGDISADGGDVSVDGGSLHFGGPSLTGINIDVTDSEDTAFGLINASFPNNDDVSAFTSHDGGFIGRYSSSSKYITRISNYGTYILLSLSDSTTRTITDGTTTVVGSSIRIVRIY